MAYGTPRAAIVKEQGIHCIPCVGELIEEKKLTVSPYAQTEDTYKLLSRSQVSDIEDVLVEGQYTDQRLLEEHACTRCGVHLRDHCTDY